MRAADKTRELDKRVEERVALRTAQLQAAKLDMDASSASIAHDLRSPLSAISGYSKMLEAEGGRLSEHGRHFLRRIRAAASQMDTMTEACSPWLGSRGPRCSRKRSTSPRSRASCWQACRNAIPSGKYRST